MIVILPGIMNCKKGLGTFDLHPQLNYKTGEKKNIAKKIAHESNKKTHIHTFY